jgi:hypothetical protein
MHHTDRYPPPRDPSAAAPLRLPGVCVVLLVKYQARVMRVAGTLQATQSSMRAIRAPATVWVAGAASMFASLECFLHAHGTATTLRCAFTRKLSSPLSPWDGAMNAFGRLELGKTLNFYSKFFEPCALNVLQRDAAALASWCCCLCKRFCR